MSLSVPTTRTPSFANRSTVSEPINPADPVAIIVRIYSTIIANRTLPRNPGHITLRNEDTQLIRSIADLVGATMGEKVNIPGDIISDIMCIEGNQTVGSHQSQIHI
jgi:hypothetical protein